MSALARGWARYNELCITRPLLTKGSTGGLLFALGDLIAQKLDGTLDSPSGYDTTRALRSFAWNAMVYTPVAHGWYCHVLPRVAARALARLPAASRGDASFPAALVKVFADQTLFGPIVIGGFMTYSALMQGRGTAGVKDTLSNNFWDILVANWMVWPALQLVNFKFVPLQLQILVMNTAVVGWSTFLALRAAGNHTPADAVVPEIAGDVKKATLAK